MGFVLCKRVREFSPDPIGEDEVSIDRAGNVTLHWSALEEAQCTLYASPVVDEEFGRMGLRAVDTGEEGESLTVKRKTTKAGKPVERGSVNVLRALKALGLKPDGWAGRYTLHKNGGLLWWDMRSGKLRK